MKTRLRNITITLDKSIARWARIEAARRDTSISGLLAGILKERMLEEEAYHAAMGRALEQKPFLILPLCLAAGLSHSLQGGFIENH